MIKFSEQGHKYESIVPDGIVWTSVTTVVGKYHEHFDAEKTAANCSVKKPTPKYPNKWYGVPVEEILKAWDSEKNRSTELGSWYHLKREQALYHIEDTPVFIPSMEGDDKIAPSQILTEGIYPEHLVYLQTAGICGQSDKVEVKAGKVFINDYKTCKEITLKGFTNYYGTKMMLHPISHLEDCHFIHYALQLSLYMYMILRHNPSLSPGVMTIEHIKFEEESKDKWGYPIYKKNAHGDFIVKEVKEIVVPYLKKEVMAILNNFKNNK